MTAIGQIEFGSVPVVFCLLQLTAQGGLTIDIAALRQAAESVFGTVGNMRGNPRKLMSAASPRRPLQKLPRMTTQKSVSRLYEPGEVSGGFHSARAPVGAYLGHFDAEAVEPVGALHALQRARSKGKLQPALPRTPPSNVSATASMASSPRVVKSIEVQSLDRQPRPPMTSVLLTTKWAHPIGRPPDRRAEDSTAAVSKRERFAEQAVFVGTRDAEAATKQRRWHPEDPKLASTSK
jgi:hypothetical protein